MSDGAMRDFAVHPEDTDDEWQTGPPPRGLRLHAVTAGLLALALLAGGFWAGSVAERHHNGTSSSNPLSALASRFAAARSASGLGGSGGLGTGSGGGAAGATSGVVTGVQGNTLYVTDSSGSLIKVQVGSSTSVTRTAESALSGLQVGDTVVVLGSKASDGTVTATSVRANSAGAGPASAGAAFGGGSGPFGGSFAGGGG